MLRVQGQLWHCGWSIENDRGKCIHDVNENEVNQSAGEIQMNPNEDFHFFPFYC